MPCTCPLPTAITDFISDSCNERLGQIQKFIIQRTKDGTTVNEITIATSNPNALATWTALKSASDGTKVQVSTYVQGATVDVGAAREYGSGNEVLGGVPITIGREPSAFSAQMYDLKQSIVKVYKELECEKELSVFLINEHGQIIGEVDDHDSPTTFKGFPIKSFFVGDKDLGGFDEPDKNEVRWSFLPNYSDMLYVVSPTDFDALTDI